MAGGADFAFERRVLHRVGTVATGRVDRGILKKMEEVEIVGIKPTTKTVATDIEMFRKLLDEARAGDNVGVLLRGVKKEDVEVTVADGMLTLSGERRQKEEQKDEKFHKVETWYGSFSRSFALPDAVDEAAIRAESKDGVLTIHVPKTQVEAKKPTNIKVQ